jgi:diguanylate cyclase (GGDEF)-like protein
LSLRARILLLVLLATIAPALVIGAYFVGERGRGIEEAKQHLGALAKYTTENLDDRVKGTVQLLYGLSRTPDVDTADRAACSEFLAGVLARYPQYTGLLTVSPDGELHCDSLRTGRRLNVSERGYFKRVVETREPAFEAVIGGLTGIAVLQVAYPVLDARGALRYVLLASLNLSEYARGVAAANRSKDLRLIIWDGRGVLLARVPDSTGASLVGMDGAASKLFRFAASGAPGTTAALPDLENVSRFWAAGAMPEDRSGGARLMLGIAPERLTAEADRDLRAALATLAVVSLLASALAWFVAETGIRRHVGLIASVARSVGEGDLDARGGPPYARGELGELMEVVDRTAAAVQSQREEIASGSRNLRQLNRVLRVLSGINGLIVRVRDRDELFREACRIAVDDGGYVMAWIGMVDRAAMRLVPVASAGSTTDFLTLVDQRFSLLEDSPYGNALSAVAIRDRVATFSNDVHTDPRIAFRDAHAARGSRSMAILPLLVSDDVVGVLALYAGETGAFDQEEMRLLSELAGNIAFAIDHIQKQDRLDYLAYYDALTGLANRGLFLERVGQSLRAAAGGGHKLALFLLDLERFKNINDSLGRTAGDELLKQVAQWLARNVGDANLVARVDADHFALMLPEVRPGGNLPGLVEKVARALMEHPFRLEDAVFRIAAKAGVAVYPDDGADAETLFRNAEAALKMAKATGERYLFHTSKMTEAVAGKLTLETQLRQAVDRGEFVLHYQPKVSLADGKLTGVEALIRWNDPLTGLVPPGRFIPMLEETGLIYEVGRWALRRAIDDYLRWQAAGLAAVRIAVNVSPLQLRHRGFIGQIEEIVGIDAQAAAGLELEISESLIMENVKHSMASLQAVRALGVKVAIDGFGTGFSSLSYLARLPVDTLKIDRSFVLDMTAGPQGLALVSTFIKLAHSLKLGVVAEGVETEEQSRLLTLLGCDSAQGTLVGAPLPADEFEARFLREGRA